MASSPREHHYATHIVWTGNQGTGTNGYRAFSRDHEITAGALKPMVPGSSDPAFRGDPSRYNPEDLLIASLSACHLLWYLHLCAEAGIIVTAYTDDATGTMTEDTNGTGRFTVVTLRPTVTLAPGSNPQKAQHLHERAHQMCFIANSVNFPVACEPVITDSPGLGSPQE